jgi:hypothetical protein
MGRVIPSRLLPRFHGVVRSQRVGLPRAGPCDVRGSKQERGQERPSYTRSVRHDRHLTCATEHGPARPPRSRRPAPQHASRTASTPPRASESGLRVRRPQRHAVARPRRTHTRGGQPQRRSAKVSSLRAATREAERPPHEGRQPPRRHTRGRRQPRRHHTRGRAASRRGRPRHNGRRPERSWRRQSDRAPTPRTKRPPRGAGHFPARPRAVREHRPKIRGGPGVRRPSPPP